LIHKCKEDPPLGHGAPNPTTHKLTARGKTFGSKASAAPVVQVPILPVPDCPRTVGTNPNQCNEEIAATHSSKENNAPQRLPLPPAKARTSDRFSTPPQTRKHTGKQEPEDIVLDSEEEHTIDKGTQSDFDIDNNDNNKPRHNGDYSETDSLDDKTPIVSEKKVNNGYFDQDDLQEEMEMDPYAFKDDEELAAITCGQNQLGV
jgi:hypothetical protein